MANTYHVIDTKLNVIFQVMEDELSIDDAVRSSKEIIADPEFAEQKFNVYVDLSKSWPSFSMDMRTIGESMKFYSLLEKMYSGKKWAMYVPEDYQYTFICIFVKMLKSKLVDIRIFRDKNEANKWLGIP